MTVDDLSAQKEDDDDTLELVYGSDSDDNNHDEGESTRASSLDVAALLSGKVNTNLMAKLLAYGLKYEQTCSMNFFPSHFSGTISTSSTYSPPSMRRTTMGS